jgi:hypothetical protein
LTETVRPSRTIAYVEKAIRATSSEIPTRAGCGAIVIGVTEATRIIVDAEKARLIGGAAVWWGTLLAGLEAVTPRAQARLRAMPAVEVAILTSPLETLLA